MAALKKLSKPLPQVAECEFFLGVRRSARGLIWRERLSGEAHAMATAISQRHGLPELMGRVLAARGATLDGAAQFLEPAVKDLMPDPSALRDMDKAAARMATGQAGPSAQPVRPGPRPLCRRTA